MSLSRDAKGTRGWIQKPPSGDFPHVKCPKYADLVESKLVLTQGWKRGEEENCLKLYSGCK